MWPPECRLFTELYEIVCVFARLVANSIATIFFFKTLTLTCNEDVYYSVFACVFVCVPSPFGGIFKVLQNISVQSAVIMFVSLCLCLGTVFACIFFS